MKYAYVYTINVQVIIFHVGSDIREMYIPSLDASINLYDGNLHIILEAKERFEVAKNTKKITISQKLFSIIKKYIELETKIRNIMPKINKQLNKDGISKELVAVIAMTKND